MAVALVAAGRRLIFLSRCLAGIRLAAAAGEAAVDRELEEEKTSSTV